MKKIFLSALLFLLIGCATEPKPAPTVAADPGVLALNINESEDFGVYVRLFQLEMSNRGMDLSMPNLDRSLRIYIVEKFNKELQDDSVIGLCAKTSGRLSIYIDKNTWDKYDSLQREMLIFHELGHCALNLGHDKSLDTNGIPNDIMYPVSFDALYYYKYRKFYLDRLFERAKEQQKEGKVNANSETISSCHWGLELKNGKLTHVLPRKSKRSHKRN